ncbi:MAG: threonine-phosphate decarboxylase [Proteobacteria bacterium]|nr:threonine-phosphate decarboxylase [Pseudomonadota bacterium]
MATEIVKHGAMPVAHGGDLAAVRRRFPSAPEPWLDLSTGINPVPYPLGTIDPEAWSRLPGRAEEEALCKAAAQRFGVRDPEMIVAAPGTQALIQLLPRLVPKSRIAIVGPTYEEHEVSWRRQGHDVTVVEELAGTAGFDVAVVVNPDNPTGRLLSPADLRTRRSMLVVDEAFIDFLPPAASLAGDLPTDAIVLRSFGKAYGLAGLRLGFAVARPDLATRLREELGPWAVSGPALAAGAAALADTTWLRSTAARLEDDRERLDSVLARAGFALLGGTPLFRLAQHRDAAGIVERLGQRGIHVRAFARKPHWLRFGLPGSDTAFRRLCAALGI